MLGATVDPRLLAGGWDLLADESALSRHHLGGPCDLRVQEPELFRVRGLGFRVWGCSRVGSFYGWV